MRILESWTFRRLAMGWLVAFMGTVTGTIALAQSGTATLSPASLHVALTEPITLERLTRGDPIATIANLHSGTLDLTVRLRRHWTDADARQLTPDELESGEIAWVSVDAEEFAAHPDSSWSLVVSLGSIVKTVEFSLDAEPATVPFTASEAEYRFELRPWRPFFWADADRYLVIPAARAPTLGPKVSACRDLRLADSTLGSGAIDPSARIWMARGDVPMGTTSRSDFLRRAGVDCRLSPTVVPEDVRSTWEDHGAAVVLGPFTRPGTHTERLEFIQHAATGLPVTVTITRHASLALALMVIVLGILAAMLLEHLVAVVPRAARIDARLWNVGNGEGFTDTGTFEASKRAIRAKLGAAILCVFAPAASNEERLEKAEALVVSLEELGGEWSKVISQRSDLKRCVASVREMAKAPHKPPGFDEAKPAWLACARALSAKAPGTASDAVTELERHRETLLANRLAVAWIEFHENREDLHSGVRAIERAARGAGAHEAEAAEAVELLMTFHEVWRELWRAESAHEFLRLTTADDHDRMMRAFGRLSYLAHAVAPEPGGGKQGAGAGQSVKMMESDESDRATATTRVAAIASSVYRAMRGLVDASEAEERLQKALASVGGYAYRWGSALTFVLALVVGGIAGLVDVYFGSAYFGSLESLVVAFAWGFGTKVGLDAIGGLVANVGTVVRGRAAKAAG